MTTKRIPPPTLNFGVEMQLSELNVGNIKNDDKFYASPKFLRFRLESDPLLATYADAETGKKLNQLSDRQIKDLGKYRHIGLTYQSHGTELNLSAYPQQLYFPNLFNDAEFIATFMTKENLKTLTLSSLLLYLVNKSIESVSMVQNYLESYTTPFFLTKAIGALESEPSTRRSRRQPPQVEWPFPKLLQLKENSPPVDFDSGSEYGLDPNSLIFFSRDRDFSISETRFHLQTTIGVPLCHAWKAMVLLASQMVSIPNLDVDEKENMEFILRVDSSLDQSLEKTHPVVFYLYPLILYWIQTKSNRKKYAFIIRHLLLDLLRLLEPAEFEILLETHPDIKREVEYLRDIYSKSPLSRKQDESKEQYNKRKIKYKEIEYVDLSSTFPLRLDGINTFLLIEFRFITQLFNSILRKNTKDLLRHLSLTDLQQIKARISPPPTRPKSTKRKASTTSPTLVTTTKKTRRSTK